jgi:putative endonuclease
MMHQVYVIANRDNVYCKGYTADIDTRISYHNAGKSNYTKNRGPWKLIFLKSFESKSEALKYERMLKRQNHKYLDWLILSKNNEC